MCTDSTQAVWVVKGRELFYDKYNVNDNACAVAVPCGQTRKGNIYLDSQILEDVVELRAW